MASNILKSSFYTLSEVLSKISYTDIITVSVGIKTEFVGHPMDGFGFLVPRDKGVRLLGGMFLSGIFPGRSPAGYSLIKCYIGGEHDKESMNLSESELQTIIEKELGEILKLSGPISFIDIEKIKNAIPQYVLGHQQIVSDIKREIDKIEGLSLAGNYMGGVSIVQAIKSGFES